MTNSKHGCPRPGKSRWLLIALLGVAGLPPDALTQPNSGEMPDLAAAEAQYEAAFTAALEASEDNPQGALMAWESVLMQASMLEHRRSLEKGSGGSLDHAGALERVLERWQRLRPNAGGPHLLRALSLPDEAAKGATVAQLLDRYPDEPLIVWQAQQSLRRSGQAARATAAVEAFAAKHPTRSLSYRMLAQDAGDNSTRLAETLARWAAAMPGDPELAATWLRSSLPQQEPAATEQMLREFLARQPRGEAALTACLETVRLGIPALAQEATACVGRIAADPGSSPPLAERAVAGLASLAAAGGDRAALLASLARLSPEARLRAVVAAARELQVPARCSEVVELLGVAQGAIGNDPGAFSAVAGTLAGCSEQTAAQQLFLALLRRAPAEALPQVLFSWGVIRVNGVLHGELSVDAVATLERRLEAGPGSPYLFQALNLAYELADAEEKRFVLLKRWQQRDPASFSFGTEHALALAAGLLKRNQREAAVVVMEELLASRFDAKAAEALWQLYAESERADRADRFAASLAASGDSWRAAAGHRLLAHSALEREDFEAAEAEYWQALTGEHPSREIAVELLAILAFRGPSTRLESAARQLCDRMKLAEGGAESASCAADLLTRAGSGEAAAGLLAFAGERLPEDLEALRKLASTAQEAGQAEVAERALRRILELDPRAENSWIGLGRFLELEGKTGELEALLEESRKIFSPPPSMLARAAGRALTVSRQARRAIDVLLAARASLPQTSGGEWSQSWIDQELRDAYRALGEEVATPVRRAADPPSKSFPVAGPAVKPTGTATELRAAAEALLSGSGGRYDPAAGKELCKRAAALGDALASFRLALLLQLDGEADAAEKASVPALYRGSRQAVGALAEGGSGYAEYLLGTAALIGLGQRVDYQTAQGWLNRAAAQGESWALHNLAWMAEKGYGAGQPDPARARDLYRRASEAGNGVSMWDLSRFVLSPDASAAACAEGRAWLERSAKTGNARAASSLGKMLLYGRGPCTDRDPRAALPWLEAAAQAHQPGGAYDLGLALLMSPGDPAAHRRGEALLEKQAAFDGMAAETLAVVSAAGIGVTRDSAKANRWSAEAARLGSDGFSHLSSQISLSATLSELVEQAVRRLEAAAASGDAAASAFLARLYHHGLAEETDPSRTVALARRGAEGGDASAMRILRFAYDNGKGVERNEAEGQRWQRRCAEAGDSFCMMFLSQDLMAGKGVGQDTRTGLAWLRRAAEAGNWWAVGDLGNLYDEGWHGIPRDPNEAARWKQRLAELGDAGAKGWLLYYGHL